MATLRDAELAREQAAEYLRERGAHAISVEEEVELEDATDAASVTSTEPGPGGEPVTVADAGSGAVDEVPGPEPTVDEVPGGGPRARRRSRRRRFAVVAWFDEEPPGDLPPHVSIRAGKGTRAVPLRVRRQERFRAE